MDEEGKTPENNVSSAELQNFPTDYHTWGCPVFVLESPLHRGPSGIPKCEPRASNIVYLGHSQFHAGSVALLINFITGDFYAQYHMVFDIT